MAVGVNTHRPKTANTDQYFTIEKMTRLSEYTATDHHLAVANLHVNRENEVLVAECHSQKLPF